MSATAAVRLTAGDVVVRTITRADLGPLTEARLADDSGEILGRPATEQARAEQIQRFRDRLERGVTLEEDGFGEFAIDHQGTLVGDCQVRAPKNATPPGVCEIGISLMPAARGHGVGTAAVWLLTGWLLEHGWDRIQATTALDNRAMRRTAERVGYTYEGVARGFGPSAVEGGSRVDAAVYAFVRGDELIAPAGAR